MQNLNALSLTTRWWKWGVVGIFLLLALLGSAVGLFWQSHLILPAPDVTFTNIRGEKIVLKKLRGKPVLVTFWATDCPSCVKEVNDFVDLYQQFHPQGLAVIAVAMYYDPPNHVVEMTKAKQIPYHVVLDLHAEHAQAFGSVPFTPTTFLISPAGKMVFTKVGLFNLKAMQQRIQQLLQGES